MGGLFTVYDGENITICVARGKLKRDGELLVGDMVICDVYNDTTYIEKRLKRTTELIRPSIANVQQIIIVLSKTPQPDFMLIDKLVISCIYQGIEPVLCVNKTDISDKEFSDTVQSFYKDVCRIVFISAKLNDNLSELKEVLAGKFSTLAGQSAVGKSTILNALIKDLNLKTDNLSTKIGRGKHTTRHTEIFITENMGLIADTPGFSMLGLESVSAEQLCHFYPDFEDFTENCRFRGCVHINEPNCAIKEAVEKDLIHNERYHRYVKIYEEIKNRKVKYE